MNWRVVLCAATAVSTLVGGCSREPDKPPQLPPPEVAVSAPLTDTVQEFIEYSGTTTAIESVEVRARVTGFLAAMHYQPNAKVDAGALLFTIDKRQFENALATAKGQLAQAKAQLESAEYTAEKTRQLSQTGAVSEQELVDATSQLGEVKASIASAQAEVDQAQLNLDWATVASPIHGRVSRNLIDVGNIVVADQTVLARIVNDDYIYVYINVAENDVLRYMKEQRERLIAQGRPLTELRKGGGQAQVALGNEDAFRYTGEIDYVAPSLDETTGTLQIRLKLENTDGLLIPGVFVRARLPVQEPHQALLVSEQALGSDQGRRYLYVVNDKNVVEYRDVQVGPRHGELREINAGLEPDERVVVRGLQRVRAGLTVKPNSMPMPGELTRPAAGSQPSSSPGAPTTQPVDTNS